ncbi:MAG TPA: hypothetical protein VNL91_06300, partial [Thermoanaerobaculia bacterium]|nr:hypothetical protein [Thermoanaerobaculia bacterium]
MKRNFLAAGAVLLALSPFTLFAQSWPVPQNSATEAPRSCSACPAPRTNNPSSGQPPTVAPLPLYGDPLIFIGRYLDSTWVPGIQQTFRTGRAYAGLHVPE